MNLDKRLYARSKVEWPVKVITSKGTMEGETRDVSTLGAFISCHEPLQPKESLLLSVELPTGSPLQVFAEVIWSTISSSENQGRPHGMGVRFKW